jgi:hypothetical protein
MKPGLSESPSAGTGWISQVELMIAAPLESIRERTQEIAYPFQFSITFFLVGDAHQATSLSNIARDLITDKTKKLSVRAR